MGCNAWNHPPGCPCGWRGGNHGGGRRGGYHPNVYAEFVLNSLSWSRSRAEGVSSYTNPNAYCPVCGKPVFFYRSQYNGRVFFDHLGPPWPKHGCTDNFTYHPRRIILSPGSVHLPAQSNVSSEWDGWNPLLFAKIWKDPDCIEVTGDLEGMFVELLVVGEFKPDDDSPIFIRHKINYPWVLEISYLHTSIDVASKGKVSLAFPKVLGSDLSSIIKSALSCDPDALNALGENLAFEHDAFEDASTYFAMAAKEGHIDALFNIIVIEIRRAIVDECRT